MSELLAIAVTLVLAVVGLYRYPSKIVAWLLLGLAGILVLVVLWQFLHGRTATQRGSMIVAATLILLFFIYKFPLWLEDQPSLSGQIHYVYAYDIPDHNHTEIWMQMTVVNQGMPTIAEGWRLHFKSRARNVDNILFVSIPPEFTLKVPSENKQIVFHGRESLAEKGMQLIEQGRAVRGWLRFQVPGNIAREVFTPGTTFDVSFRDYRKIKYSATIANITPQPISYYPGTEIPQELPLGVPPRE